MPFLICLGNSTECTA